MTSFIDITTLLTEKIPLQNIHDATYPATDGHIWEVRRKNSEDVFYVEDLSLFMHKIKSQDVTTWGTRFYAEADPAVTPKKTGTPPNIVKNELVRGESIENFEARLVKSNPEITIVGGMEKYIGVINSRLDNASVRADYQSNQTWDRSQPAKYPIGPNNNIIFNTDWQDNYTRKNLEKDIVESNESLNIPTPIENNVIAHDLVDTDI